MPGSGFGWEGWLCRSSSGNTLTSDQPRCGRQVGESWANLWIPRLEFCAENCASVVSVAVRALCQQGGCERGQGLGCCWQLCSHTMGKSSSRDELIRMCFALSDNPILSEKDEIQDYCPDLYSPNTNDGGVYMCRLWHTLGLWYLFLLPLVLSFSF